VSTALVVWHAKRMRRILLLSVACPALASVSTSPHKNNDFQKKTLLNVKRLF
jgi:hypothetical protein